MFINDKLRQTYFNVRTQFFIMRVLCVYYRQK